VVEQAVIADLDGEKATGEKYAYNNIGYWLLGKIIEKVAGHSYSAYVKTNIPSELNLSVALINVGLGFVVDET
jgi:CubicO group peptidase (beta-lactamase class C family)